MLSLFGRDEVILDLYRLARVNDSDVTIETSEQLRRQFLAFLSSRQPWVPMNWSDDPFVLDPATEDQLSLAFSKGMLDDLSQSDIIGPRYPDEVREQKLGLARRALETLFGLDDELALVFGLAVHSVFVRTSQPVPGASGSHGGSSSSAIGSIWLTVSDSVGQLDVMEMFVHELTHHLLFIDELNHAQFDYAAIARPENFAFSAILKKHRPLDKVIHSIIVACEILAARRSYLAHDGATTIHPPTAVLHRDTVSALDSVYALPNLSELVTPRTEELLRRCTDACGVPAR